MEKEIEEAVTFYRLSKLKYLVVLGVFSPFLVFGWLMIRSGDFRGLAMFGAVVMFSVFVLSVIITILSIIFIYDSAEISEDNIKVKWLFFKNKVYRFEEIEKLELKEMNNKSLGKLKSGYLLLLDSQGDKKSFPIQGRDGFTFGRSALRAYRIYKEGK